MLLGDILIEIFSQLYDMDESLFSCVMVCRIWAKIAIPILCQNPFKYWKDNPNIDSLKEIIYYKLKDEQDILKMHFLVKDKFIPLFSYLKYVKE
ncbi:11570_t:CDS:1, partial [Scutellospora calospora]